MFARRQCSIALTVDELTKSSIIFINNMAKNLLQLLSNYNLQHTYGYIIIVLQEFMKFYASKHSFISARLIIIFNHDFFFIVFISY